MRVSDAQVKKMRKELHDDNNLSRAAMKADMDRKTARKYRDNQKLPSDPTPERSWRTRPDPFEADWPDILAKLEEAPGLEARTLFEDLIERRPGIYQENQLRTLQRRVRDWRSKHGPEREVDFAQDHRPGEAMQTDFTWCNELNVTIGRIPFSHMLCHCVLPFSNWQWAKICHSESLLSLRCGVQSALRELDGRPEFHQTDNSTAATHNIEDGREFNVEYARWMDAIGMKPRTIEVGESKQNGDVEALNGALKRRLEQQLQLRGSRDFDDETAYEVFIHKLLRRTNLTRSARLAVEREKLLPVPEAWFPEYVEEEVRVTAWSTVRVKFNTYSVPSRLIGHRARARVYDDRIEIWRGSTRDLSFPRLLGRNGHSIDYRHLAWSLVQKPGAFARYRYREDLFPSLVFRRAYDALAAAHVERIADLHYVRILHLAAGTSQAAVEAFLATKLDAGLPIDSEEVRAAVKPVAPKAPSLSIPAPSLKSYDRLLPQVAR